MSVGIVKILDTEVKDFKLGYTNQLNFHYSLEIKNYLTYFIFFHVGPNQLSSFSVRQ